MARGFIYYVSREGVTGARESVAERVHEKLAVIRQHTDLPVAVGFGISDEKQAKTVARWADAVVVGSAIVDLIGQVGDGNDLCDRISKFASPIAAAVHDARH